MIALPTNGRHPPRLPRATLAGRGTPAIQATMLRPRETLRWRPSRRRDARDARGPPPPPQGHRHGSAGHGLTLSVQVRQVAAETCVDVIAALARGFSLFAM
jgi:hypothetical protein